MARGRAERGPCHLVEHVRRILVDMRRVVRQPSNLIADYTLCPEAGMRYHDSRMPGKGPSEKLAGAAGGKGFGEETLQWRRPRTARRAPRLKANYSPSSPPLISAECVMYGGGSRPHAATINNRASSSMVRESERAGCHRAGAHVARVTPGTCRGTALGARSQGRAEER